MTNKPTETPALKCSPEGGGWTATELTTSQSGQCGPAQGAEVVPVRTEAGPDRQTDQNTHTSMFGAFNIRGALSGIASRLPELPSFAPKRYERWTVRIFTRYRNDRNEEVDDSMELQFGSKEAAEKYWDHRKMEMEESGRIIPLTVQIFKTDQPPPPIPNDAPRNQL